MEPFPQIIGWIERAGCERHRDDLKAELCREAVFKSQNDVASGFGVNCRAERQRFSQGALNDDHSERMAGDTCDKAPKTALLNVTP